MSDFRFPRKGAILGIPKLYIVLLGVLTIGFVLGGVSTVTGSGGGWLEGLAGTVPVVTQMLGSDKPEPFGLTLCHTDMKEIANETEFHAEFSVLNNEKPLEEISVPYEIQWIQLDESNEEVQIIGTLDRQTTIPEQQASTKVTKGGQNLEDIEGFHDAATPPGWNTFEGVRLAVEIFPGSDDLSNRCTLTNFDGEEEINWDE